MYCRIANNQNDFTENPKLTAAAKQFASATISREVSEAAGKVIIIIIVIINIIIDYY
jgi:hypothetical protein